MLKGKKIILCVTGSIAAYKSVFLLRLLKKAGAEVKVIMTEAATEFVAPLTFSTLSGERAMVHFFENENWENHVMLGRWADIILIAPASADFISRMAGGICDNLVLAVYLSAACPVMIAPAMDVEMWHHPIIQENLGKLGSRGVSVLNVEKGELASGLTGEGRMAEPEVIFEKINLFFEHSGLLKGTKILITAGPTVEPLDPVRFISNRSTGKMGISLAETFYDKGADVKVVAGPVSVSVSQKLNPVMVQTASEMFEVCMRDFESYDIVIMAAAVADYTPVNVSGSKIKKSDNAYNLSLKPTEDVLAAMGKRKKENQLLIGFALETDNERENARLKLRKKNLDFIIMNSLKDKGAGFGVDSNKVTIFGKDGSEYRSELKSKEDLAVEICNFIIDCLKK